MRRRRAVAGLALAALLSSLVVSVEPAQTYIGPNPNAPYRSPGLDTEFWNIVKNFNDPTQVGKQGDLVRTGMNNARVAGRLLPALSALNRLSLSASAFTLGWKIGRFVDTRFLHLSGDVGRYSSSGPYVYGQAWEFVTCPGSIKCVGWASGDTSIESGGGPLAPGRYWKLVPYTSAGMSSTDNGNARYPCNDAWMCGDPWDGGMWARYNAYYSALTDSGVSGYGALYTIRCPDQSSGCQSGQTRLYARFVPETWMSSNVRVDRSEAYVAQPFDVATEHAVPADSGSAADKENARVALEQRTADSEAAQKHVNHQLAPTNPNYPDPIATEIDFPLPLLTETYDVYLARLRANGWLGTATVVQLDEAGGDPGYAAAGVPCTNVRPYTSVTPDLPVTFYRNPTPLGSAGGGDSSSWDCRAGDITPPPPGECEYDQSVFSDYSWKIGRVYAWDRYEEVCAEAWAYFGTLGGPDLGSIAQILGIGRIMNSDVRTYLTGDGESVIEDWRKAEWGPFTITSSGQSLTFVVHAYVRADGSEVRTGYDFKIKFRTEIEP